MRAPESSDPRWDTYPETILEIQTSPPVRVDLRAPLSAEMAPRLRGLGLGPTWGTVTAHNPGGLVERAINEKREKELTAAVAALGAPFVAADGVSPDGTHREPGYAIGLDREGIVALACDFGQSAIFWFDGETFWIIPALVGDVPIRLAEKTERTQKKDGEDGEDGEGGEVGWTSPSSPSSPS
jgi:hypothetical protein